MRTINLNGYIDEEVWYGDEITPAMLHDALYGENGEFSDDVRIMNWSSAGSSPSCPARPSRAAICLRLRCPLIRSHMCPTAKRLPLQR